MIAKSLSFSLLMVLSGLVFCQPARESSGKVRWRPFSLYSGDAKIRPSKSNCGIYSTREDRQAQKLSLAVDCTKESRCVKPGFVHDQSAIRIVQNGKRYKYLNSELYGYRDCGGIEYHFYDGRRYELVNSGERIGIYRTYAWVGKQRRTKYFYAIESGIIKPLTLENLETDFRDNTVFLEKLRYLAKTDFELIKFRHAINLIEESSIHGI